MSPSLLALCGVVFGAMLVEAAIGFGATVISVAIGAQLVPIETLLPPLVALNMGLSATIAARGRGHVAGRLLVRRVLPLMGAGVVVGVLVGHGLTGVWLRRAFGAFVVTLAIAELVRSRRGGEPPALGRVATAAALGGAGVIHGLFGTGGPLAVLALSRALPDKSAFRATLSLLWLSLNVGLVTLWAIGGRYHAAEGRIALALAVPVFAGLVVGDRLHARLDAAAFRIAVDVVLLVAGVVLLLRR